MKGHGQDRPNKAAYVVWVEEEERISPHPIEDLPNLFLPNQLKRPVPRHKEHCPYGNLHDNT